MTILKRTLAVATALTLAVSASAATLVAQSPNFAGRWELNAAKSDFGMMASQAPSKSTLTITQTPGAVKVAQSMTRAQGEMSSTTEYTLDGKQASSTAPDGAPVTNTARMDGETLEIGTKMTRQGAEIVQLGRWTLSADGNTLTVDQNVTSPMGAMTMKLVYDKKNS